MANEKLSKPEQVRERVAKVCSYHYYCCKLWTVRCERNKSYDAGERLKEIISAHRDKTNVRIEDIMFGHPCGISIA